jgi:hypothetical protein
MGSFLARKEYLIGRDQHLESAVYKKIGAKCPFAPKTPPFRTHTGFDNMTILIVEDVAWSLPAMTVRHARFL